MRIRLDREIYSQSNISFILRNSSNFGNFIQGKLLAIYGILINVVGSLLATIGGSGGLVGWVFGALVSFVIYYLIVISKFPSEAAPVSAPTPVV